jgi:hypothetical protein
MAIEKLNYNDIVKKYKGTPCEWVAHGRIPCSIGHCPVMKCKRVENRVKSITSGYINIINKPKNVTSKIDIISVVDRVIKSKK